MNASVIDAGPLIHLEEVGGLSLLEIFDVLHLPQAVWEETVGQSRLTETQLNQLGTIQRVSVAKEDVATFIQEQQLENLHFGERECLCFCKQEDIPLILMDDLAVRDATKNLELTPVGSLGIVVRNYHLGIITLEKAQEHLYNLQEISSLFVTPVIVELAIKQLKNFS